MIDDYIVKSLKLLNTVQYELDEYSNVESLKLLNTVHSESDEYSNTKTSLLYPKKRDSSERISEQEAKILFCHILLEKNVAFSVETPTIEKYSFTGNTKRSGNLDLCIYEKKENKYVRSNCIEYKAHNESTTYQSDIEKLLSEKGNNYFVHILDSVNSGTLYTSSAQINRTPVINKYIDTIKRLNDSKACNEIRFDSLTFYICILNPFCIITNKIYKKDIADIDTKLKLEYWNCVSGHFNYRLKFELENKSKRRLTSASN